MGNSGSGVCWLAWAEAPGASYTGSPRPELRVFVSTEFNLDPLKVIEELDITQTNGFANKIKASDSLDDSGCRLDVLKISLEEKVTRPQPENRMELYLLGSLVT